MNDLADDNVTYYYNSENRLLPPTVVIATLNITPLLIWFSSVVRWIVMYNYIYVNNKILIYIKLYHVTFSSFAYRASLHTCNFVFLLKFRRFHFWSRLTHWNVILPTIVNVRWDYVKSNGIFLKKIYNTYIILTFKRGKSDILTMWTVVESISRSKCIYCLELMEIISITSISSQQNFRKKFKLE